MQTVLQQKQKHSHTCCSHKDKLCQSEIKDLLNVIRQRYISPYKIIYMINQQEADLFKLRNQSHGCCSSSSITIPKHQMTKTERFLSETIDQCLELNNLNKILQEISDKFDNIVNSGKKENLKVDEQVEKFLVEKTLSERLNFYIYKILLKKLKNQNDSISSSAMLWATPQTWYSRYPDVKLNFLSGQTLSNLVDNSKGFGIEKGFLKEYQDNLLKQLRLLEQDGRFQQLIWLKQLENKRNDLKVMNSPEQYSYDGSQEGYREGQIKYPNLKKSLLTLRSIPFELNQKLNVFCTISENNQISYFKNKLGCKLQLDKKSQYSTFCAIGGKFNAKVLSKTKQVKLNAQIGEGDLLIVSNTNSQIQLQGTSKQIFLFKSWICTLEKKQ